MRRVFLFILFFSNIVLAHAGINYCTNGELGAGWKFNEASGGTADCTLNGNTGTLHDDSGTAITQGVTGKYQLAISSPNNNHAYVLIAPSASLNNLPNVSMGGWIKPNSAGQVGNCTGEDIITKMDVNGRAPEFCINANGSLEFRAWWTGSGVISWTTSTTPVLFNGTFQHVAVTYSYGSTSNVPIIYYNGVSQTVTGSGAAGAQGDDSGNDICIANQSCSTGNGGFDGVEDEMFYANVVLSSTDVSNIMNCGLDNTECGPPPPISGTLYKIKLYNMEFY